MSGDSATTQQRELPVRSSSVPSGPSLLEGIEFAPAGGPSRAVRRVAGHRIDRSIAMSKRSRYAILIGAVVAIVGVVVYLATRDSSPPREQGLVGPKGPPPTKNSAPR